MGMDDQAEEDAVPGRTLRVPRRRHIAEVPAETVISGEVVDDGGAQEALTLIQSLGLEVVAVRRAKARGRCASRLFVPRLTSHPPGEAAASSSPYSAKSRPGSSAFRWH